MEKLMLEYAYVKPFREDLNPYRIRTAFNFYMNDLKPLIAEAGQPLEGPHGLNTHTTSVVFRGIDYALHIGCNPIPVVFACAFHDMARNNDNVDQGHGQRAIPMATKIMKKFPYLLDSDACFSILYAILNHSNGLFAKDCISSCLWDADRTRMAWCHGYNERFFNTNRGRYVAQHCRKYLEFQQSVFPTIQWSRQY